MTDEQLPFDLDGLDAPAPVGLVERAYRRAVTAAGTVEGSLEEQDAGMIGLALALARAADQAWAKKDVRGMALVAKELRETSARLQLDPTARGASSDTFGELLAQLSQPSTGPASVGDAP